MDKKPILILAINSALTDIRQKELDDLKKSNLSKDYNIIVFTGISIDKVGGKIITGNQ